MINPETGEALIDFPCHFMFKATGKHDPSEKPSFEERVIALLRQVDPDLDLSKITRNSSKTGKYIALTLHVHVKKQADVDRAYTLLKSDITVLWGL